MPPEPCNCYYIGLILIQFRKECEAQVKGFSKARYKKFGSRREAEAFMSGYDGGCCSYYAPVLQPTSNYYAPDHRPTSTYDCLHTRRKGKITTLIGDYVVFSI